MLCARGEDCAILFARTPIAGRVKSRLLTHLSPEEACGLHCASTSDVAALLDRALPGIPKWLFFSEHPVPANGAGGLHVSAAFRYAVQQGADLGDRMAEAFSRAFASGARRAVIFGSDSPTLPEHVVRQAFDELAEGDMTLGPTEDGGYYLIGCRPLGSEGVSPELFREVEWSTPRTFRQTLENAERLGYRVAVLEPWFDLDEWKDVERLLAESSRGVPLPQHLSAFLRQFQDRLPASF